MGLITIAAHLRGFASATEGLQLGITVNSIINGSQFINGWGGKANIYDRLRGMASVHDRLGGRVDESSNNELEEMADSLVPNEDIMCQACERRRTLQLDNEKSSQSCKKPNPQWYQDGLTESQKRRVQRLRQLEQQEEAERHVLEKKV
jgi:hypothetical protein